MKLRCVPLLSLVACTGYLPKDSDDTGTDIDTDTDIVTDTVGPTNPEDSADSGGTNGCPGGVYQGPLILKTATVECANNEVRFALETEGLASEGAVYSQETGNVEPQWADNHTLQSYEFDACGYWDKLERTLDTQETLNDPLLDWQRDVSTVFPCDYFNDDAVMTFALGVYDTQDNLADCLSFGDDPQGMKSGTYAVAGENPDFDLSICVVGVEGS